MPDDQAVVQVPAAPPQVRLRVSVQTAFLSRNSQGVASFDWAPHAENVGNAQVEIQGAGIQGVTNGSGNVHLVTTNLADGMHTVRITHTNPDRNSTDPVGPDIASGPGNPPSRIYRPLEFEILTSNGFLHDVLDPFDPDNGVAHGRIGNRRSHNWTSTHLPVDWRPIWMHTQRERGARAVGDIELIVVHHTGGARISGAIHTLILNPLHHDNANDVGSAHYLMNVDGHTIKIARESQRISHVGAPAGWAGFTNVNTRSIGIEVVHANGEYPEAQYQALLPLLGRLQGHGDFNIPAHRIVGHSDADRGSRREDDPGMDFDWQRVQDLGLGVIPGFSPSDDQTMYAGFWANNPAAVLSSGANGNAVRELQQDLVDIGYVLSPAANQGVNGNFNVATERAVHAFQSHFFSRNQDHPGGLVRGRVDIQTAFRIKNVVAGVP